MRSTMSRRNFLRFAGGAAGVALLAACAPAPGAAPAAGGGAIREQRSGHGPLCWFGKHGRLAGKICSTVDEGA